MEQINEEKVHAFVGKAMGDLGAALTSSLVVIGDKLGLYRAMADSKPITSAELAEKTETSERCCREWLSAQAAAGYVDYDATSGRFTLPAEHAIALTNEESPACVIGGFQAMTAAMRAEPKVAEAFKHGNGVGWHEHDRNLFVGTERFFRPGYNASLVDSWIPALEGAREKLERGATMADIGCGHGASTIILAKAFPNSTFVGFDYHEDSVLRARERAEQAGVADRVTFEVSSADSFAGKYDLVACFDCLHDMGDPVGAARHIKSALNPDGNWLLVEPYAGDAVEENLNPVGRIFYSVSTLVCTQAGLSQDCGHALGAQAGEAQLGGVIREAGFTRFRRAAETPFNLVFDVRP